MPKVALITIHSLPNYGSVLQTFATQHLLEQAGIECEIIDYLYPNKWHFRNGTHREPAIRRILATLATPILRLAGRRSQHVMQYNLRKFKEKYFNTTKSHYKDLKALEQADWTGYDAVIAGSDQIWNPRFHKGDKAFMLSFVPDNVRKISISSSFASSSIPSEIREVYSKYLSRFDFISVRENNGLDIISSQLKLPLKPVMTLDPTLLLSSSQWSKAVPHNRQKTPSDPYIILFGLYYAFEPRPYIFSVVEEMQQRFRCKTISIGACNPNPAHLQIEDRTDAPIDEFVSLLKNAKAVVTSSFHGTAFALNFGRPLISIVPSDGDDRQSSILRLLGAESCITPIGTPLAEINPFYDTDNVTTRLETIRQDNTKSIIEAIKRKN